MAELTLKIPDELAQRLEPIRDRLPDLLYQLLEKMQPSGEIAEGESNCDRAFNVYQEIVNFLVRQPTPEEIVAFKVSSQTQKRLQLLLDKNRESMLSSEEMAELDTYEELEHLIILLKATAHSQTRQ